MSVGEKYSPCNLKLEPEVNPKLLWDSRLFKPLKSYLNSPRRSNEWAKEPNEWNLMYDNENHKIIINQIKKWKCQKSYFSRLTLGSKLDEQTEKMKLQGEVTMAWLSTSQKQAHLRTETPRDWKWLISALALTSSFVTHELETNTESQWNEKLVSERNILWIFISDGFYKWSIFPPTDVDGSMSALGTERGICRQSGSRQMSDNTIVWWVWMTATAGCFLYLFLSSFIFFFSRALSGKWQL